MFPRRPAWISLCLVAALALGLPAQAAEGPQLNLPRVQLQAGLYRIDAQVAQTEAQHEVGLMHRQSMPEQEGMLFVFEQANRYCFWMKNTLLPLSIAFIADDGRIVNIEEMQAQSTQTHCAAQPVRYALEMNRGWFSHKRLQAGAQLRGPMWVTTR